MAFVHGPKLRIILKRVLEMRESEYPSFFLRKSPSIGKFSRGLCVRVMPVFVYIPCSPIIRITNSLS